MNRLLLLVSAPVRADRAETARAGALAAVRALDAGDILLLRKDAFPVESSVQMFRRVAFMLNGTRLENGIERGIWYDREKILPGEHISWPLHRDRELVKAAAKAIQSGWETSVLILCDTETDTTTEHLVRTCKELKVPGRMLAVGTADEERASWREFDQVWLDLETTGLSPEKHAIVQIGAQHTDPSGAIVRREFDTKVKPWEGAVLDPYASQINGYNERDWKDALEPSEALSRLLAWLPPRFVFANQSASFDRYHLETGFARFGLTPPGWHSKRMDVCTKKMANRYLVKPGLIPNAKLETICTYFGVSNTGQHDALTDARRARLVYLAMRSMAIPASPQDADEEVAS